MKKLMYVVVAVLVSVWFAQVSIAGGKKPGHKEHGGKEHGGKEHDCKDPGCKEHGGKEHGGKEHSGKEHGGKEHGGKEQGGKEQGGKEHGGKEHGGKEHGGKKVSTPSSDDIRNAMKAYVTEQSKETGVLSIFDPEVKKDRKLALQRVHERVGKTGDYYYSCADFKDTESGELLDLDLDVEDKDGVLGVVDVRIHKLEGKERYTYDEKDNRIPLKK